MDDAELYPKQILVHMFWTIDQAMHSVNNLYSKTSNFKT